MRYLILIIAAILFNTPAAFSQDVGDTPQERPLTRREVRRWLTISQDDPELSAEANRQLIVEIARRKVDFVLSDEEEWSFTLLEASDELLEAIRLAIPEEQRLAILEKRAKRDLYAAFLDNYTRTELQSRRAAHDAGQEFVKRFGNDPTVRNEVNLINRNLPQLDRIIKQLELRPPGIIRTQMQRVH